MTDFENESLNNISERERTLDEIERVLFTKRYKLTQKHLDIFSVQSISMMYSIWEGFIQTSFELYIAYLNRQYIDFKDFKDEIKIFHMENTFKSFNEYPNNSSKKIKFYDALRQFYSLPKHNLYNRINTQSNVSFEVLNLILKSFCLSSFPEHWKIYTYPNPNLMKSMEMFLRYRNAVAHGGDISSEEKVTQSIYNKYKKMVLELMYEIHEKMMDGIQNKTYLK